MSLHRIMIAITFTTILLSIAFLAWLYEQIMMID